MPIRRPIVLLTVALTVMGWISITAPTASTARAATLPPAAQHDLNGDHVADVLATTPSGALWLYPGRSGGGLGTGRQIGSGWGGFDQLRVAGQFDGSGGADLVARAVSTGALWLWPGNGLGGFGTARQIGKGWGGIRDVVAPGDWNGDGTADLLGVRASDGTLWLYPGAGLGAFGTARQIGLGWSGRDSLLSAGDFDGDGATDLISRTTDTGELWLDRGNGAGGFAGSRAIGHGWAAMTAITGAADANGDRRADLIARDASGQLWLYRGTGTGSFAGSTLIGRGWNGMTAIVTASVRGDATLPAFAASVAEIDAATLARMQYSHRPGCPVATVDLRLVKLTYYGFDRISHTGELVVHRQAATDITRAFGALYVARFPIQRMLLVDAYRGDDNASMAANNTSAYNCRTVAGTTTWSEHAYGTAIDINPVHNPYVQGTTVSPPAGRAYLDRGNDRPGMIVSGDVVVRAFATQGWLWGGNWTSSKDYQHFSASGR